MAAEPPEHPESNTRLRRFFVRDGRLRPGWRLPAYAALVPLAITTLSVEVLLLSLLEILTGLRLPDPLEGAILQGAHLGNVLVATWLARRYFDRRPLQTLGFQRPPYWWRDVLLGLALGAGLMLGLFAVQAVLGCVHITGFAWQAQSGETVIALALLEAWNFAVVAVVEELIIRGYVLQTLTEALDLRTAMIVSSAIFALLHAANPNVSVLAAVNLFAAGLMFALAYVYTRRLWLPIALHFGWNFVLSTVLGYPVSGWTEYSLVRQADTGPALLTGGAFGPEAGVLGLIAILAGIALLRAWARRRARLAAAA